MTEWVSVGSGQVVVRDCMAAEPHQKGIYRQARACMARESREKEGLSLRVLAAE